VSAPVVVPATSKILHKRLADQKSSFQSTLLIQVDAGSWSKKESASAVDPEKVRLPPTTIWSKLRLPGGPCVVELAAISHSTVEPAAYDRSPAIVLTSGELPGACVPATVTLPRIVPAPPRTPPGATATVPDSTPLTDMRPAFTTDPPVNAVEPVSCRIPSPVFTSPLVPLSVAATVAVRPVATSMVGAVRRRAPLPLANVTVSRANERPATS